MGAVVMYFAYKIAAAGMMLGAASLAAIVVIYCYEVLARYVFDAPTRWASDFVTYLLCWSIFLVMPELSARNAHVSVAILTDRQNSILSRILLRLGAAMAFLVSLATAYISVLESFRQIEKNVTTMAAIPVFKWVISLPITYGFFLSAVFFLARSFDPDHRKEEIEA